MGWSARKKFGPLNVSWSPKRGWNLSAGAGGLRIGANRKGSYVSANKSLGPLRYSKRVSLDTPQRSAHQAQGPLAPGSHQTAKTVFAIVAALGFVGLFAAWLLALL